MGDDPSRGGRRGEVLLRWSVGGLAFALLVFGVIRAAIYFGYAAQLMSYPLESHQLESKMVLLAYRAQVGLSLYPEWRLYPHVADFFAPIEFLLVGTIGRLAGADLRGLFLIGRGVSFASGLIEAVVLGVWAGRRYGRGAGFVAAVLSVGARPMDGFSVTTRPDMLAELLGVVGFLMAGARLGAWRAAGVGVLVLAAFTKQTAVVYLIAAAAASAAEGHRGRAAGVLVGGLGAIATIVAVVTLAVEPNFARSLVGEAATPRDIAAWIDLLTRRLAVGSPDVLLLPAIGLAIWSRGPDRSPRLVALTAATLAAGLVASMKRGSDVNYFLGLRAPEAMAAAALWAAARGAVPWRRPSILAATLAAVVAAMVVSTTVMAIGWMRSEVFVKFHEGPAGKRSLAVHRLATRLAADPASRMLTDSGYIDIHAGDRAVFGDPWLFRMLVETGRIDPKLLIERIESGYYSVIITGRDFREPAYESNAFGFPRVLVGPLRRRYELSSAEGRLFLYTKKGAGPP